MPGGDSRPALSPVLSPRPACDLELYRNAHGEIRLENVRSVGLDVFRDRAIVEALYAEWVADDNYLVLEELLETGEGVERLVYAVKARKRGNDVDVLRTATQLQGIAAVLEDYAGTSGEAVGQLAFVTLTWAAEACDPAEAWDRIGPEWNRYLARLRRRFGSVLVLRSFETTDRGYPHIHAVLAFREYVLADLWVNVGRDDRARWRCGATDRAVLSDWPYHVDVQAVVGEATARARVADVLWYVAKGPTGGKETYNRAVVWYLGKRSWSVSSSLRREAAGRAAADDSTGAVCITQTPDRVRWVFIGMVRRVETEIQASEWEKVYADPPPWIDRVWVPNRIAASRGAGAFGLAGAFK